MQLAPLTSDEWKSKLTQLTAQGTGVRIKGRGGCEKRAGDVKLLNDTLSNWVDTGVVLIRRIGSSPLDEAKSNIQAEEMQAFNRLRNRIDNFSLFLSCSLSESNGVEHSESKVSIVGASSRYIK